MPPRVQLATLLLGPFLLLGGSVGVQEAVAPSRRPVYAEHPPLGHTRGFGEPTCHACHFGGEVNGGDGTLAVDGLPESVRPRPSYRLTVTLAAEMKRSGFMLAVRHPDGRQAGLLAPVDTARVSVGTPDSASVQYAYHTLEGRRCSTQVGRRGRCSGRLRTPRGIRFSCTSRPTRPTTTRRRSAMTCTPQ